MVCMIVMLILDGISRPNANAAWYFVSNGGVGSSADAAWFI